MSIFYCFRNFENMCIFLLCSVTDKCLLLFWKSQDNFHKNILQMYKKV